MLEIDERTTSDRFFRSSMRFRSIPFHSVPWRGVLCFCFKSLAACMQSTEQEDAAQILYLDCRRKGGAERTVSGQPVIALQ